MVTRPPIAEEARAVLIGALALVIVGLLTETAYWPLIGGIFAYLAWNLYHLVQLFHWLDKPKNKLPDQIPGLWGYLYYRLRARLLNEKKRKKQIKRLLKEFSNSAKALPDATIVLNRQNEIQWANDAATDLLHVRRSDSGRNILDLIRNPDFRKFMLAKSFSDPIQIPAPRDHRQILHLQIVPYGNQQYLLLARDITERKKLEQMRRDFIANASHELRTPLTVLQGSLDQLKNVDIDNVSISKPIEWMRRQSDRMQTILEDLLTLARLEGSRTTHDDSTHCDSGAIIESTCRDAGKVSEQRGNHIISARVDSDICLAMDAQRFRTAVSNLIMNAVNYTPEGGSIEIAWERHLGGARFSVRDTGVGIPEHHLARLTERFYRVDVGRSRDTGGTGLGLAIVKHILDQYESSLDIQSEPGVGSTFSFTIPPQYVVNGNTVGIRSASSAS